MANKHINDKILSFKKTLILASFKLFQCQNIVIVYYH